MLVEELLMWSREEAVIVLSLMGQIIVFSRSPAMWIALFTK